MKYLTFRDREYKIHPTQPNRERKKSRRRRKSHHPPETERKREVLRVVAAAERAAGLGGGAAPGHLEPHVAAPRARRAGPGPQLGRADLDAGLGQEPRGQLRVEGTRHRQDRQVLGADAPVLARHVRVQAVAGLGDGAAEDAPIARADGVLVLEVGAQRVRRPVDLAALGTGPRVRRAHSQDVDAASGCGEQRKCLIYRGSFGGRCCALDAGRFCLAAGSKGSCKFVAKHNRAAPN